MDVNLILEKLQELGLVRLGRVTGSYRQVHCPFHSNGQEKKPSCGVLLQEEVRNGSTYPQGLWHCFACGTAKKMEDAITAILESKDISQSGLDWLIENIPGFEAQRQEELEHLIPIELVKGMYNQFAINYIQAHTNQKKTTFVSEEELQSYRYTVPYMYERGLTDEIIEKYDIGVDMNFVLPGRKRKTPSITFPVRDREGRTLFIGRRSIEGKIFNYPDGVTKPVYGIDMIPAGCRSLVLAESCFNAWTIVKYGYPAVALLGTGNDYQIQQLKELGIPEFVICTDGDEAGRKAAKRLKRALSSNALIWTIPMPEGKDANDCTFEEFQALYSQRE